MLESFGELISNNLLYRMRYERPKLDNFRFWRARLPRLFATLPKYFTKALNIVWPKPQQLKVIVVDDDVDVVIRPDSQSVLGSSYRIRSLLFSAAG